MDRLPLVSIIVPVYNVEAYLPQCLDSIIHQTYQNIEILVTDDGSTDRSGEICDNYREKDNRITVSHQENSGLPSARNVGLDRMHGEFILFVDSDDYISPETVETLVNQILTDNCDCLFFRYSIEEAGTSFIPIPEQDESKLYGPDEMLKAQAWNQCFMNCAMMNKFYRASLFTDIRFRHVKMCEDVEIMPRILARAKKCRYINKAFYHYYSRASSITHKKPTIDKLDAISAMLFKCAFYYSLGRLDDLAKIAITSASLLSEFYIQLSPPSSEVKAKARQQYAEIKKYIKISDTSALPLRDKIKVALFFLSFRLYTKFVGMTL